MANIIKKISQKTPKNIAIIMDGNGRWAIANSLNVSKGHKQGVEVV
ncbi:undecaprenyl diphosphate synthase family protein, partial [Gammaproteobacteria bacterium]|nr:undecaprenyl diphosphate synthase family protein [Gammaproteobacteria bacterium]